MNIPAPCPICRGEGGFHFEEGHRWSTPASWTLIGVNYDPHSKIITQVYVDADHREHVVRASPRTIQVKQEDR